MRPTVILHTIDLPALPDHIEKLLAAPFVFY
jgi:hypothetical protein